MLEIEHLVKTREREKGYRLEIRHLRIRPGDAIAITGPSGCGKSTALDMLGMILRPDSARRFLFSPAAASVDMLQLWEKNQSDLLANLRRKYIGYVLQTGGLFPFLTAGENMKLTARMNAQDEADTEKSVGDLAARLGIDHLFTAMPETLSVGERQRVAIVRALAPSPQLILADEPTAALDPLHAGKVLEAFLHFANERGSALVMVTHDADLAHRFGMRELRFVMEQDERGVCAILDDHDHTADRGENTCPA